MNPIKPITLAVGGYTGKLGKSTDNWPTRHPSRNALRCARGLHRQAHSRGRRIFCAKNWNNVNTAGTRQVERLVGLRLVRLHSADRRLRPLRLGEAEPGYSTRTLKDHYFNVGVDYKPIPPLDFALVYKRDRANNGFLQPRTARSAERTRHHGTYDEIGLFGQLVF